MKQTREQQLIVRKSNQLITAKYKSSALENKLMAIGLLRLDTSSGIPRATIHASELRSLLGAEDDRNIYRKVRLASLKMLSSSPIIVLDNGKNEFLAFSMLTSAGYQDQKFTLSFNQDLLPYISNLKSSYTSIDIKNIMKLDSSYAIRMYELIKKEAFRIKGDEEVTVEYNLSELKFELGAINIDNKVVEELKIKGATWDEIEEKYGNKTIKRWNMFEPRILRKCRDEIKRTDLCFDYEPIKARHGTVVAVRLFIRNNLSGQLPTQLLEYVDHNGLTLKDLSLLYDEAGEDADRVVEAIRMADSQPHIENYMGYLRSAIRENWTGEKVEVIHGSKESADRINAVRKDLFDAQEDPNGDFFKRLWAKAKTRPEYQDFAGEFSEMEMEYFDLYDYKSKLEKFFEWKNENR